MKWNTEAQRHRENISFLKNSVPLCLCVLFGFQTFIQIVRDLFLIQVLSDED